MKQKLKVVSNVRSLCKIEIVIYLNHTVGQPGIEEGKF